MILSHKKLSHYATRIFVLLAVFLLSIILGSLYVNGDQFHYTAVYSEIGGLGLSDAYKYYNVSLTSLELVHFFLIWLVSDYVEKTIFIAVANTLFASLVIRLFDCYKVHFFVTATFLLSNFYMYVLYVPAERLKFGFIIFTIFMIYAADKNKRFILSVLSVAAHYQMLIIYLCFGAVEVFKILIRLIRHQKIVKGFVGFIYLIICAFILLYVSEFIMSKAKAYSGNFDIYDYLKLFVFLLLALIYSPKLSVIALFFPLFLVVSQVGQDRVNMIGYLFFLFIALQCNRGLNWGVLLTGIYFFYKTVIFVNNILYYGTGFI